MPSFAPPPLFPFCLPMSSSLLVTAAHSQVDGRHQKGWVRGIWDKCVRDTAQYRWGAMSLWKPVSGHISSHETTHDDEERGANTQGQGGNVERLPPSKSTEGSEGWAWAGSSAPVSFKLWICILAFTIPLTTPTPPLLPNFPSPKSFSTCRTSSSRSAPTGPSWALWPTALFDFVFVCATRGGVGGGKVFFFPNLWRIWFLWQGCQISVPSTTDQRQHWVSGSVWREPPARLTGAHIDQEYVPSESKLVPTEWCRHIPARWEPGPFTGNKSFIKLK